MKKAILFFIIIIFLLVSNHTSLKGEKSNCQFHCAISHCSLPMKETELEIYHESFLPYYPFYMSI
jgi:hypothetical protein